MEMQSKSKSHPKPGSQLCEYCNKTLANKQSLKFHKTIHTGQKPFKCTFCDVSVNTKDRLEYHIRTAHTKERPFKCPHPNCQLAFLQKLEWDRHQIVHRKNDESLPKFQCPEPNCSFKTIHKSSIAQHLRSHSNLKPFPCSLCPYRAKSKGDLKIHHDNVHSTEKKFKCPQPGCNYSFKRMQKLSRHMNVHTDDRPFPCFLAECNYRSKSKYDLQRHERRHRGEKPFKCSLCPYSCNSSCQLVSHSRVHTGETPYPCQVCPYRAKSTSTLSTHVKTVHSGKKKWARKKVKEEKVSQVRGSLLKCRVSSCTYSTGEDSSLAVHFNATHNLPRVVLLST